MDDLELEAIEIEKKMSEVLLRSVEKEDWQAVILIAQFKLKMKKKKGRKK